MVQPPRDGVPAELSSADLPDAQLFLTKEAFDQLKPFLPKKKINYRLIGMVANFILLVTVTAFWLIPASAPAIAKAIPLSWEKRLSNLVFKQLVGEQRVCLDKDINHIIDKIGKKLSAGKALVPIKLLVVQSETVNAYALPAGRIVIHSQLIADAQSPEELAAVVAHEIGHIANNHVMENAVRSLGILGLLDVATGGGGTVIYFITQLYNSTYSRDKEREADEYAARLMTSQGYSLEGMVTFFSRMNETHRSNKTTNQISDYLQWISTHPATDERIKFFIQYPKPNKQNRVMSDAEWQNLKDLRRCTFK